MRFASLAALLLPATALAETLVLNPSFEASYNPEFPHYGPVEDWTGGSGTNLSDGPFHNGGTPIPDQEQIVFLQGAASLSQFVPGVVAGESYWVQFFYDARACCSGGIASLSTSVDGIELDRINNIVPVAGGVGYRFRNVAFTPDFDGAEITFQNHPQSDATALIDGVCIVARGEDDAVIANPSFEASGTPPFGGDLLAMPGWDGLGFFGVVAVDGTSHGDNGTAADQDHAAFLEAGGELSQVIPNLTPDEPYAFSFAYNAKTGATPRLQVLLDGAVVWESDVTPVGGTNPFLVETITFTTNRDSVEIGFVQSNPTGIVLLDDVRITGDVPLPVPCLGLDPPNTFTRVGGTATVFVTVDALAVANGPRTIVLASPRPDIVALTDADEFGELVITIPQGEPTTTVPVEITGVGAGNAALQVLDSDGLCVETAVNFSVTGALVTNPSFDATTPPPGVGYGSIPGWNDGSGFNNATMPFADNGVIPDRNNVAFLQNSGSLSQDISGLTPGENYWLQFHYNTRLCCGDPETFSSDLAVFFDGQELANLTDIQSVGVGEPYHFGHYSFTAPASGAGLLEFVHTAVGDATVLIDAVSIVPRPDTDIVVANPSFEATLPPSGVGYVGPAGIAGWETASTNGNWGINIDGAGPFTDNGLSGAGESVLLIQNAASVSQTLNGFTPGQPYTVQFLTNARDWGSGGPVPLRVSFDGTTLLEEGIDPVGIGLPYHTRSLTFTPATETGTLTIENTPPDGSDLTLLVDDVRVFAGGAVEPTELPPLSVDVVAGSIAELSWPTSFTGWTLETSTDLATWAPVDAPPNTIGENFVVSDVIFDPARHYRLVRAAP